MPSKEVSSLWSDFLDGKNRESENMLEELFELMK